MKCKRAFMILLSFAIAFSNLFSITTFADMQSETVVLEDDASRTAGLIFSFGLNISGGSKKIYLTANTYGTATMAEIGFTNIKVQHSTNGSSGWTDEVYRINDIATNTNAHFKSQEGIPVAGGYYYRVVLDHYAKEKGWFFPSSESITNYSNVVWVPA